LSLSLHSTQRTWLLPHHTLARTPFELPYVPLTSTKATSFLPPLPSKNLAWKQEDTGPRDFPFSSSLPPFLIYIFYPTFGLFSLLSDSPLLFNPFTCSGCTGLTHSLPRFFLILPIINMISSFSVHTPGPTFFTSFLLLPLFCLNDCAHDPSPLGGF